MLTPCPCGPSVTTPSSCAGEGGGATIAMPTSPRDPHGTTDSGTSVSAPSGRSPSVRAFFFEFSHHSGALRRLLMRVANSSPRSPDQQQRPPSHRPRWKLVRSHCHCPERRRHRDPSRSGHRWAMGATSPLSRPLSVADVLAVQNGTGFVRPVTETSHGCTSASGHSLDRSVYKRPNHMQSIRILEKKRWTLTNPPSGSQCDEIGDRKWFRRQLQDLKRWFIRAKVSS